MNDETWEMQSVEATSNKPLVDSGTGGEVSIRIFKGKFPIAYIAPPPELELWEAHEKYVRHSLWKDGWEQIDNPRVITDEKEFTIFVPCKPRLGQILLEKAHTLQEYANTGGSK